MKHINELPHPSCELINFKAYVYQSLCCEEVILMPILPDLQYVVITLL